MTSLLWCLPHACPELQAWHPLTLGIVQALAPLTPALSPRKAWGEGGMTLPTERGTLPAFSLFTRVSLGDESLRFCLRFLRDSVSPW